MEMKKLTISMVPLLVFVALSSLVPSATVIHAKVTLNQHQDLFPNKRQAHYVNSLSSYDIVTPIKVTEAGGFVSHDLTHAHISKAGAWVESKRRKRREIGVNFVHYSISLSGEDHIIQLEPNHVFLAPAAVVEIRDSSDSESPKIGNVASRINVIGSSPRCHFVGHVANHTTSKVALSTCDGLHGFVKTDFDEFLIEPVKDHKRAKDDPHLHLVYSKSSLPKITSEESKDETCNLETYEKSIKDRIEWEDRMRAEQSSQQSLNEDPMESNTLKSAHKRQKRSVSLERNVEVLVVADKKMIDYYANEDLNTYILTVMNMVSSIFHDASIGNAVNIIIVRIMLLETPQYEEELHISHEADETLSSFCRWQQMVNPSSENHPHHHDVAVLLTRYNICSRTNDHCSTLGLAEIAGMCQMHRSCNVNEDTGLQIAYTIAHEIGHNFGMNHDGAVNGCGTAFGVSGHVMSPHLASDSLPITWSNCSRHEITKFLDRDWGNCLEDEPQEVEYNFPELPPGAMYDASHQCRLIYGPTADHCHEMEVECDTLWCKVNDRCVTRLESAAEGTQCGKHKWCSQGKCVTMGDRPTAIHGSWGQWSSWSSCSRSCGAGVELATRHCDNPAPANGGKYCTGDRRKYRICNTQDCPADDVALRAIQCSEFDNMPYKGKNYTWRPVTLERSPCQLHCIPDNEFYSVELKDTVVDGTPCKPGTRDMCIHGVCKRVTCDWTIEGFAQEDRCGLCHGDGTQCVTTKDIYSVAEGASYVSVSTFPVGARNVRVEELGDAANYLAIRDMETGRYHLNGNWIIQWSGEYSADGVMIYYKRDNETESIFLPGPIKRPLTLMLLFQTRNPGIRWEYTLPHENATYTPEFHWQYSDWTFCTHTCGGGTQSSKGQCMEKEAGLVEERYCNETRPEDKQRECNTHPCPAWWWSGPWQPCSATCGSSGTKRRTVICVRSYGPTEQMALLDSDCVLESKPHEEEECQDLLSCPSDTSWTVGPWIESCRGDPCEFERRDVKCSVGSGLCNPMTRPTDFRQCGNISCGHWETREWSECSTTCGEGVQIRDVHCVGGSACIRIDEPGSVKECHLVDCPPFASEKLNSKWMTIMETAESSNEIDPSKIQKNKSRDILEPNQREDEHSTTVENVSTINEKIKNVTSTNETILISEPSINETANEQTETESNNSIFEEKINDLVIEEKHQETLDSSEKSENLTQPKSNYSDTNTVKSGKGVDLQETDPHILVETAGNATISSNEGKTQTVKVSKLNETSVSASGDKEVSVSNKTLDIEFTHVNNTSLEEESKTYTEEIDENKIKDGEERINKTKERENEMKNEAERPSKEKENKGKDESFIDYAVPDDYYDPVDALDENSKAEKGDEKTENPKKDSSIKLKNSEVKKKLEDEQKDSENNKKKVEDKQKDPKVTKNELEEKQKDSEGKQKELADSQNDLEVKRNESEEEQKEFANKQKDSELKKKESEIIQKKNRETEEAENEINANFLEDSAEEEHKTESNKSITSPDDEREKIKDNVKLGNETPHDDISEEIVLDLTEEDDDYADYAYENDEDSDYNETTEESDQNATDVERPQGFVDDKINVEGVQVIEIINRREKKNRHKKIKKVKIHTGEEAIKILNRISKKANTGKSAEVPHQSSTRDVDDEMMPHFKWTIGPWSKCSETCGGGSEHRAVECHNTSADSIVPPWKCHTLPPPDMRHCNMFKCENWSISEFGSCIAVCGEGFRFRNATCPTEGRCNSKDVPALQEVCTAEPCVKWIEGPWSMCTKSCGGGYQIRFVKCVDIRTQEASQDCTEERPPHKKPCNVSKCQKEHQSQQNHCKDHMDTKLCRRLINMCTTKFIRAKCCRTCHRKGS